MRFRSTLLVLVMLGAALAIGAGQFTGVTRAEAGAAQFAAQHTNVYMLPPGKLEEAIALNRTGMALTVAGTIWALAQLLLLLRLGVVAHMRDFAVGLCGSRWVQGFSFVFLVLILLRLLDLPLSVYGHHVALSYGLSVQGWGSWLTDMAKEFALEWGIGGLLAMLMFWVVRRSPADWWFWFWIPSVVVVVAGVFATPYVIDPLFNKFEPMTQSNPALVDRLEHVVARGGLRIPPDRMFVMKASAKSAEMNAYVTGFGASKRVVVWDTAIAKSSPDEISFIFAHEMGHYALDHVAIGTTLTCIALLPFFWLGCHGVRLLLLRYGAMWRVPSQQDWGALVVLVLVLSTLATAAEPAVNGFSRRIEHNADVYGQEAVHGIVADPQAVGVRSFQVLGEDSLDDPTPHPLFDGWFGTHPTIEFRAAFAKAYDPWATGERPKYFAK